MSTNDHTVPQMYLRRFAELKAGKGHYLSAAPVGDLERAFPSNVRNVGAVGGFYWASRPDGVDHHEVEELLTKIEDAAAPALRLLLDDKDYALPTRWPLPTAHRLSLSWWIAAQVLRTTRQRARIDALVEAEQLKSPPMVGKYAENHAHLDYMLRQIGGLARRIFGKPWGVGFSDACLLTGDVPVVILNGQDDPDQDFVVWFDEVYLPLDPHRFLLLPGHSLQAEDRRKRVDHRLKLDGGVGLFFNEAVWAAASKHVFFHPQHNPLIHMNGKGLGPRLPEPGTGGEPPTYALEYPTMPAGFSVLRRWLTEHAPPKDASSGSSPTGDPQEV